MSEVFRAGYVELAKLRRRRTEQGATADPETHIGDLESIQRALERARTTAVTEMENRVPLLATTASAAPFIGLFGTVWGIVIAFQGIASAGNTSLGIVAQPIAEALIATAAGLFAAIPAVYFYNHFTSKVKKFASEMDDFSLEFLNICERNFT